MKTLLIVLLLFPRLLLAQDGAVVTLNAEQLERFKVVEVKLMERELFTCDASVQTFANADFDSDGVLDDVCVGLRYDPCDYFDTYTRQIILLGMTGGCKSLEEIEAARGREEACNGFSPQPEFCRE